jgi:hypothetical protein
LREISAVVNLCPMRLLISEHYLPARTSNPCN